MKVDRGQRPAGTGSRRQSLARLGWIAILATGCLITGFVAGLVLGGFIPAFNARAIEVPTAKASDAAVKPIAERVMPDVRGLSDAQARQVLADMGLADVPLTIATAPHLSPATFVVAQVPLPGTSDPASITLTLPTAAVMPELSGQTEEAARGVLQTMGADIAVERRFVPGMDPGVVIETTPQPGAPLPQRVNIVIAAPAQQAYLADVKHEGTCSTAQLQANGVQFAHGLRCDASTQPKSAVWLLNRRVQQLVGTLGIDDDSDPGTTYAVRVIADGKVLLDLVLAYGETRPLDHPVAGVLRLEVSMTRTDTSRNRGSLALGDWAVTGGQNDLDTLRVK